MTGLANDFAGPFLGLPGTSQSRENTELLMDSYVQSLARSVPTITLGYLPEFQECVFLAYILQSFP